MSNASRPQIPRPPVSPLRASSNAIQGGPYSTSNRRPSTALGGNSPSAYDSAHRLPSHGPRHSSVNVTGTPSGSGSGSSASNLTIPSTLPAGVANPNQQQKARAKDLLRKHYGLGVGPPPPRPVGSNSQDPMDMNSAVFDAKSYYEQLITTSTLPALLKRENELLSEIRQLEGDRQSLVYNHHHELIAASDTISAMKSRAESLDFDLDLLRAAFSDISRLTTEVSLEQNSSTGEGDSILRTR